MELRALTPDESVAWQAIRLRLAQAHPWAMAGIMRCIPVASPDVTTPSADPWGRIYVDFTTEKAKGGLPRLAEQVFAAIGDWLAGRAIAEPWHASRLDDRFPALSPTESASVATIVATELRQCPNPAPWSTEADFQEPWRKWADALVGPPQVSWQQALAAHVRQAYAYQAGAVDYTYSRPSRRRVKGAVLPAMRRPVLRVGIVADVSPSIVPHLPFVLAEINRIGISVGLGSRAVTVYATDQEVLDTFTLGSRIRELPTRSDGGTDLRVGIEAAMAARPRPNVIVVLTDGFTPWPETPPRVPFIVALIGTPGGLRRASTALPAYGDVVRITTPEEPE